MYVLDVLREDIHYNNIIESPHNPVHYIVVSGETVSVKVPDFNNILGDKLTAFAP
jgi:tRNA pseudouridine-54 N-methylase